MYDNRDGVATIARAHLASLVGLSAHIDPTLATHHSEEIRTAAASLAAVPEVTATALAEWAQRHPAWVPVLGLAVGLSQERLRNALKHHLDTTGWVSLARERPHEVIAMLDGQYDLVTGCRTYVASTNLESASRSTACTR